MGLFGLVIVLLLSGGYDFISHYLIIKQEMTNLRNIAKEVALHVESNLKEKITIATTLSSAPLIKATLLESNSNFAALSNQRRKREIGRRNQQWIKTTKVTDPFIQLHMNNPVAEYFKYQQRLFPREYGEIFLTNRYGVMIATTNKLTTLAHTYKYWWLGCYDDGRGKFFLDDRGFDVSVQGAVIGVVIPVKDKNEIIGIVKCNMNIRGLLTDIIQNFNLRNSGRIKIARTGGLIVAEHNIIPFSTLINKDLIALLRQKKGGTTIITENNKKQLVAFSPILITMGSKKIGFGGSKESTDHIKGNEGEGWYTIISLSEKTVLESISEVTLVVVIVGIIFTFLTAVASLLLGKWIARPIVKLSATARLIGQGNLDIQTYVRSNDEIGSLSKSLSKMVKNLKETMASRDELQYEIKLRRKTEEEREMVIQELKKALKKVKLLSGFLPICSYCKNIRDDKGYWKQIEQYIHEHSEAEFSHSICQECAKKYYPNMDIYGDG